MGLWSWILGGALAVTLAGLGGHLARLLARPYRPELSAAVGSPIRGVAYAFTWGMMPWAKESTRRHLFAYVRGIVFHAGIGAAFLALLLSPWREGIVPLLRWTLVAAAAAGALAGVAGLLGRFVEPRLRRLSTPDDFFAVALVSAFSASGAAGWVVPAVLPLFYLLGALTLIYIPFGKIRHCFYFFFSRYFFGVAFGRRGVLRWGKAHE
jgi:nitrate reductase gamma subunit